MDKINLDAIKTINHSISSFLPAEPTLSEFTPFSCSKLSVSQTQPSSTFSPLYSSTISLPSYRSQLWVA